MIAGNLKVKPLPTLRSKEHQAQGNKFERFVNITLAIFNPTKSQR
jgi:hypothetical protein